ncbi:hypothetical protein L7F22_013105 [Adiantum nelumboides]|nr:hypothetical protein [Adiantum nelumboides]
MTVPSLPNSPQRELQISSLRELPRSALQVSTLIIIFFAFSNRTRALNKCFTLEKGSLGCHSDTFVELPRGALYTITNADGKPLRGVAKRHTNFCKFLISMCTQAEEAVIDCFAGVDLGYHHDVMALEMTLQIVFARMGNIRPSAIVIDKSQQELEAIVKVVDDDPHSWIVDTHGAWHQVACHVLLCWFHAKKAWVENLLPQV